MQIPPTSADLRILQNLRFFAVNNKTQKRPLKTTSMFLLSHHYRIHVTQKKTTSCMFLLFLRRLPRVTGNPRNAIFCDTSYLQNEFDDPGFFLHF